MKKTTYTNSGWKDIIGTCDTAFIFAENARKEVTLDHVTSELATGEELERTEPDD